jgi:HSP20 family protein
LTDSQLTTKEVEEMNGLFPRIRTNALVGFPSDGLLARLFAGLESPRIASGAAAWTPAIDVSESPKEIVVRAEVPGMDKNDLDITLSGGLLTIRGEKRAEKKAQEGHYLRLERRYGTFCRTLPIPETVRIDAVDASYKDGLLTVKLPKRPEQAPKRVTVQTLAQGN